MVGDEAQLYRSLAPRLERIVRAEVRAPREVIEDACHHAWTKLINHSESVSRDAALSWLTKTAIREAWKLNLRERRELSLDATAEDVGELPVASQLLGPAEQLELREQLGKLVELPERQQRLVWLRAAGLTYVEMAAYTGDTVRTVERQVLRATERVRAMYNEPATREREHLAPFRGAHSHTRASQRDDRGLER